MIKDHSMSGVDIGYRDVVKNDFKTVDHIKTGHYNYYLGCSDPATVEAEFDTMIKEYNGRITMAPEKLCSFRHVTGPWSYSLVDNL